MNSIKSNLPIRLEVEHGLRQHHVQYAMC